MTAARDLYAFRLPDRPEREPDDMTSYRQLAATSIVAPLRHYLGDLASTLVTGEQYLCPTMVQNMAGSRYPDLLIAFDADIDAHERSNGYIIAEQGKPPDFVLEIASHSTGREDVTAKRDDYERFGVLEYWRFDETADGSWHGARLAGDRLVDGVYQAVPVERVAEGVWQGYSQVLNVLLRWENGRLRWHDPETGRHIATFADERERAERAEARAGRAEVRAGQSAVRAEEAEALAEEAEARAEDAEALAAREREARLRAEARARELEARLEGMGDE